MSDRKRLRYVNPDDPSAVSLPAHYGPLPTTVTPGDVFEVDAGAAELMADDDRFEPVDDDAALAIEVSYPDRLAALRAWLEDRDVTIAEGAKLADLIDLAEAYVARNPQPTGSAEVAPDVGADTPAEAPPEIVPEPQTAEENK